ncbi:MULTISPECIES: TIGR03643 family protein [unclassified Spirosoma]|uniref:TIGR03643 family protein n=1 Tax=unclassified Spirosoma TaxID=2621999 RepID=UPI0009629BB4|nr:MULTISPECIES: TIGR03643 family protein [unclassified Spirosoma]MBN8822930.1 TIGR03643 family protein [Spirosoma sp.]OJW80115.1 MAG: TIGR03643 family protein [Spirosoma sp. 48-14]
MKPQSHKLSEDDLDRLIEMAWEDRTPFDAIEAQFGLPESVVIKLMREHLKPASWRRWRARVQGRSTKHAALSAGVGQRFKSDQQRSVTHNRISKR